MKTHQYKAAIPKQYINCGQYLWFIHLIKFTLAHCTYFNTKNSIYYNEWLTKLIERRDTNLGYDNIEEHITFHVEAYAHIFQN